MYIVIGEYEIYDFIDQDSLIFEKRTGTNNIVYYLKRYVDEQKSYIAVWQRFDNFVNMLNVSTYFMGTLELSCIPEIF